MKLMKEVNYGSIRNGWQDKESWNTLLTNYPRYKGIHNATRLSSIIFNLRRQGLNITSTDVEIDGVKFSRYKWVKKGSGVWNG